MEVMIIDEDKDILVIDKPAGVIVFEEKETAEKTLIDYLLEKFPELKNVGQPPRYGIIHRLDKDTSGILLVAKNNAALAFFQSQFQKRQVKKNYLTLVAGKLKEKNGIIETLIGRAPKNKKKQRVYLRGGPEAEGKRLREAKTLWRVVERFWGRGEDYTLLEVNPKTGRKHQIRSQFAYLGHPVCGDKLYSFKRQPLPKGLSRQFLHASYLKLKLPNGQEKEFYSELPPDLKEILKRLKSEKQYE